MRLTPESKSDISCQWRANAEARKITSDAGKTMSYVEKITSDIIQITSDLFSLFANIWKLASYNGNSIWDILLVNRRLRNFRPNGAPNAPNRRCRVAKTAQFRAYAIRPCIYAISTNHPPWGRFAYVMCPTAQNMPIIIVMANTATRRRIMNFASGM